MTRQIERTSAVDKGAYAVSADGLNEIVAQLPTADQKAGLDAAPTPITAENPAASMADAGGGIDYIQAEDPGAVGAGKTWLQPFGAFDNYGILSVRDESDTFWYQTGVGFQSDTTSIGIEVGSRIIRMVTNDTTAGLMQFKLDLDNGLTWAWAVDGVPQFSLVAPVHTPGALLLNGHPIGTQCANQPVIAPEATAADAAFNALRTAMIASGLMAPAPS